MPLERLVIVVTTVESLASPLLRGVKGSIILLNIFKPSGCILGFPREGSVSTPKVWSFDKV